MEHEYLQAYLSKYAPLKPLLTGPTLSEDDAIRWLIDEGFRASKAMIKTHHREDIIRFIVLVQVLDSHGYTMLWIKHKGCVGATRKGGTTIDNRANASNNNPA